MHGERLHDLTAWPWRRSILPRWEKVVSVSLRKFPLLRDFEIYIFTWDDNTVTVFLWKIRHFFVFSHSDPLKSIVVDDATIWHSIFVSCHQLLFRRSLSQVLKALTGPGYLRGLEIGAVNRHPVTCKVCTLWHGDRGDYAVLATVRREAPKRDIASFPTLFEKGKRIWCTKKRIFIRITFRQFFHIVAKVQSNFRGLVW